VADAPHDPKPMELLPLLSERIDALKSPVWKVRLKTSLAQILATSNPQGARQLFEQSLQMLEAIPVRRPTDTSFSAEAVHAVELNSLRSEVLMRAAIADPQSAEALLETMANPALAEPSEVERSHRRRSDAVGQASFALAKEQPELAAKWIEKGAQTGFTVWTHLALETFASKIRNWPTQPSAERFHNSNLIQEATSNLFRLSAAICFRAWPQQCSCSLAGQAKIMDKRSDSTWKVWVFQDAILLVAIPIPSWFHAT